MEFFNGFRLIDSMFIGWTVTHLFLTHLHISHDTNSSYNFYIPSCIPTCMCVSLLNQRETSKGCKYFLEAADAKAPQIK